MYDCKNTCEPMTSGGVCERTVSEPTMHELLQNMKKVVTEIDDSSNCIASNLFGSQDKSNDGHEPAVSCANDLVLSIINDLVSINNILDYVRSRL